MTIIGVIPARMASSRFPGKPLAAICGMPMLGHVYHRSRMSRRLEAVYIATCDPEIEAYAHRKNIEMHRCPAQKIAADLGSPRSANQVLLGALSRCVADFPTPEHLASSIATVSGNRGKEANLAAFTAGREWKPA